MNHNIFDIIIKHLDGITIYNLSQTTSLLYGYITKKYIRYTICNNKFQNIISISRNIPSISNKSHKIHYCIKKYFTYDDINDEDLIYHIDSSYIGRKYYIILNIGL